MNVKTRFAFATASAITNSRGLSISQAMELSKLKHDRKQFEEVHFIF